MSSDESERGAKAAESESTDTTPNISRSEEEEKPQQQRTTQSLLVEWDGDNDPLDPRTFSPRRKWFYVIVVSTGSMLVTAASSFYIGCYGQLVGRFGISEEIANLGLSLYVLGLALGPLLFSPLSEFYGRRPIYITSITFFLIWLIPCAVAQNMQTLLVARFLNGLSGSAFLAVAGGTIVDLFVPQQLLIPMTIFAGSAFTGPVVGPLVGGFINSFANWRWTFYVLIIWTGVMLVCVLLVPETYHPTLLSKKAAALRKSTSKEYHSASDATRASKSLPHALLESLYVPFQLLFLDPMVAALSAYTSLLQGILYLCFGVFPSVFVNNHGFNLWQVGLSFLGLFIGNVIGCMFNPYWHKNWIGLIGKMKAKHGADYKPEPELRLPPTMVGSVLVTVSLFWFAWTTFPSVHWIVPIIATVFFAAGYFFVYQGIFTFLAAAYPRYAASVMAVNTTTRCLASAAFPLFTDQMLKKIGYQWAMTLIAFLTLALLPFPYIFYRYGKILRGRSKFASA